MIKFLKYSLLSTLLLSLLACREEENNPFPGERLGPEEQVGAIRNYLVEAEHGWKFVLKPDVYGIGGFNVFVKFNDNGNCDMIADLRYQEGIDEDKKPIIYDATKMQKNINFSVKKVTNFELAFQSYCFVHKLIDLGILKTFQFSIGEYSKDSIYLYDGESEMLMTKMKAEDWTSESINEYLASINTLETYALSSVLFNYVDQGEENKRTQIVLDRTRRSVVFHYQEEGNVLNFEEGFSYSKEGIVFDKVVEIPGLEPFQYAEYDTIFTNEANGSKTLLFDLDDDNKGRMYSSVRSMIPVDDGVEHFFKVKNSSQAKGGRFWACRKEFEKGFRYKDGFTFWGAEDNPYFIEMDIYLYYHNPEIPDTYNTFTFVYDFPSQQEDFNVYFLYEKKGSDQIVFRLEEEKGYGGYSTYITPIIKEQISGMIEKLMQPEGFTLVSTPFENLDGSLNFYLVDNKEEGFMTFQTGNIGIH